LSALTFTVSASTKEAWIMAASDTDRALAYLLVRSTIGASLFGHAEARSFPRADDG
jgi:hypothetical protein